jgi:hypothetical protein
MAMSNDNKKGEQLEILTSTSETHTGAGAGDNDDNDDNDDNNADNTNDTNDTNDGNVANDKEDNCNQEQLQNKFDEIPMKDSESTVDATDAVGSGELVCCILWYIRDRLLSSFLTICIPICILLYHLRS